MLYNGGLQPTLKSTVSVSSLSVSHGVKAVLICHLIDNEGLSHKGNKHCGQERVLHFQSLTAFIRACFPRVSREPAKTTKTTTQQPPSCYYFINMILYYLENVFHKLTIIHRPQSE